MVHDAGTFASLTTNDNIKIGIDDNKNEVGKDRNFEKDGWLERDIYSAYSWRELDFIQCHDHRQGHFVGLSWWPYNIRTSVAGVLTRH